MMTGMDDMLAVTSIPTGRPVRHDPSPFVPTLDGAERDELVRAHLDSQAEAWDGPVVRLDRLEPFEVSVVGFFDLLATNIALFTDGARMRTYAGRERINLLAERVRREAFGDAGAPATVEALLGNRRLANVVAVSVLAVDPGSRAVLARRGRGAAISSGLWSATAGGSVEPGDLDAVDPFAAAARREAAEELGADLGELRPLGLVFPAAKPQPIACYAAEIESADELASNARPGSDHTALTVVALAEVGPVEDFLARHGATAATAWSMWQEAARRCSGGALEAACGDGR